MTSILQIVNYKPCKHKNFKVIMTFNHIITMIMLNMINDILTHYHRLSNLKNWNKAQISIFVLACKHNPIKSLHFSHLNEITSSYKTINVDLIFKFVLHYAYPFSRSTFLTLVQLWPFMNSPFSSFYKWPKYLNTFASRLLQYFIIIMSPKTLNSFQQVRISLENRRNYKNLSD